MKELGFGLGVWFRVVGGLSPHLHEGLVWGWAFYLAARAESGYIGKACKKKLEERHKGTVAQRQKGTVAQWHKGTSLYGLWGDLPSAD